MNIKKEIKCKVNTFTPESHMYEAYIHATDHDWQKVNKIPFTDWKKIEYDVWKCSKCCITAKRHGMTASLFVGAEYPFSQIMNCPGHIVNSTEGALVAVLGDVEEKVKKKKKKKGKKKKNKKVKIIRTRGSSKKEVKCKRVRRS